MSALRIVHRRRFLLLLLVAIVVTLLVSALTGQHKKAVEGYDRLKDKLEASFKHNLESLYIEHIEKARQQQQPANVVTFDE